MEIELKPCPFCGGYAQHFADNEYNLPIAMVGCFNKECGIRPVISEHPKSLELAERALGPMIERWNTRASQ